MLLSKITLAIERAQTLLDRGRDHGNTLAADRMLREEQERDLAATMAADRERMSKAKADREAAKAAAEEREEEEALAEAMLLSEKLNDDFEFKRKKELITEEPAKGKGVTQIRINIPAGGRVQRRFLNDAKIIDVRNYIDVEFWERKIAIKNYDLATNFPKRTFGVDVIDQTLSEAGLVGNVNLFIYDLDLHE